MTWINLLVRKLLIVKRSIYLTNQRQKEKLDQNFSITIDLTKIC